MVTAWRNIHGAASYLPGPLALLPALLCHVPARSSWELTFPECITQFPGLTQSDSTSGKQQQVTGGQRERDLRSLLSHGSGRGCVPLGPHLQPRSPSSLASAGTGLNDNTRTSSGLCRRRSVKSFLLLMAPGCLIISLALYLSANIPLITFLSV